jgi:uncharacterized membrane protein affecting hemolysin expression
VARNKTSIRRTLIVMILVTSATVLVLTSVALITYDFLAFRQTLVRNVATLGEVIATNSTAALAFDNHDDAQEILKALKAERHIVAAGLYGADGALFATYPRALPPQALPSTLAKDGYYFERSALIALQPRAGGHETLGHAVPEIRLGGAVRAASNLQPVSPPS